MVTNCKNTAMLFWSNHC